MDRLEQLALGNTVIHRLHPMAKLLTTAFYVVIVISFPSQNVSGLVPFVLYPVVLMSLSQTPGRPLLGRLAVALPFSLAGGISNLLLVREAAFHVGNVAVSQGAVSCASILLKTLLSVLAVLLLIATTSFVEIGGQLARLHMPKIFCLQLIMTYRYISVLLEEAVAMYTAYALRANGQRGIGMRDMGSFLGQLLLRSFDRAERVYQAMKCRGFQGVYLGRIRAGLSGKDALYTGALMGAMLMLRFFNLSLFLGSLVG